MRKVCNDRMSGQRRSARLERRSPWRDENNRDAVDMLDPPRSEQHWQLRRLRNERVRCEIDRGADHAIIVAVAARLLGGKLLRLCACAGDRRTVRGWVNAVEMDVPERQDELQRQRGKR